MPFCRTFAVVCFTYFLSAHDFANAGVEEIRLNESSFQIRFEAAPQNDTGKVDRQFLFHVATAVKKYGFDRFVFQVPTAGNAVVLVQGALTYQPAVFAKATNVREAIIISYKKMNSPPDAFDAKLVLENPIPVDDVAGAAPADPVLPPASEVLAPLDRPTDSESQRPKVNPPAASPLKPIDFQRSSERSGFAFGILMPTSAKARFSDLKVYSGANFGAGSAEFELETAPAFNLEYFRQVDQGWGFRAGVMIDKSREIKSAVYSINGSTITGTNSGSSVATLQFMTFHASSEYTSGNLYFPIGLNVTNVTFDPGYTSTTKYDYSGGFGVQAGLGVRLNQHLSFDILYLVQSMTLKGSDGTTRIDFGTGYLPSINVGLKLNISTDDR